MEKKMLLTISFISVLLFSAVAGTQFVNLGTANPYSFRGQVPPDQETFPSLITVTSPTNNTAYNTNRVTLKFNVDAPQSTTASGTCVHHVAYKPDWQKEATNVFQQIGDGEKQLTFNYLLSNIPEGQHTITINTVGAGSYRNEEKLSYTTFFISSTATIIFTIDCTAPTVSVLSLANRTFALSDVPLAFTVNEAVSQIAYSLDGGYNMTATGNVTLSELSSGLHNVTVYAWDECGNMGASETIHFTIAEEPEVEPFAVAPVAVASAATVAVVGLGLLVYFKKRKKESGGKT
jgi:hypothetical protein